MHFYPNEVFHVYNRGNNRQRLFFREGDYLRFIKKIRNEWKPFCDILCWCLMPNHFHVALAATIASCKEMAAYGGKPMQLLSRKIGISLSSYSQYINLQQKRTGSLFQQKTKSKSVATIPNDLSSNGRELMKSQTYFKNCVHYIHQNPMRAGLVNKMEDWPYSSFIDYAGLRNGTLCNSELFWKLMGDEKGNFYQESYLILGDEEIKNIW